MIFTAKDFYELSLTELYEIMKARTEIFLLEQKIICQDFDDIDYISLHCFFNEGKKVTAYLRAFQQEKGVIAIGRVLTLEHGKGVGTALMKKSIAEIKKKV